MRPWQGIVTPFAADPARSVKQPAIDDNARAAAGAENDADHVARAGSGAIECFGEGKAIGVVREPDGASDMPRQILAQGLTVEPGRVGVLYAPREG
jgi:hypothetical protein